MYIKEFRPPEEAKLYREDVSEGYITNTSNCNISVLCKSRDGREVFIPVKYQSDIKKLENQIKMKHNNRGRES